VAEQPWYTDEMDVAQRKMKLQRDAALLLVSVSVAVLLVFTGAIHSFSAILGEWGFLGAFLAGIGFSSAFFAAPATVVIFGFAQDQSSLWLVAIVAALGAMVGDMLIFRFLRDGLGDDFRYLVGQASDSERLRHLFRSRLFYWFGSFIAALVIASPLPDEIGLAMFGLLRFNTARFLPISFALNFLGILVISLLAQLPDTA